MLKLHLHGVNTSSFAQVQEPLSLLTLSRDTHRRRLVIVKGSEREMELCDPLFASSIDYTNSLAKFTRLSLEFLRMNILYRSRKLRTLNFKWNKDQKLTSWHIYLQNWSIISIFNKQILVGLHNLDVKKPTMSSGQTKSHWVNLSVNLQLDLFSWARLCTP